MKIIGICIGVGFMLLGIVWALLNQYSCNKLCGSCDYGQLAPCYFLFIFVGIILVIGGISLVLTLSIKENKF